MLLFDFGLAGFRYHIESRKRREGYYCLCVPLVAVQNRTTAGGITFNYLLKTACTDVSRFIVKLQFGAVPEQPPLQLTNDLPAGGTAVSVTIAPSVNFAEQVPPQSILLSLPAGLPVTVPGLLRPIDKVYCGAKVAFTCVTPSTVTEQVNCLPLHRPLQPVNTFPPGFAVKV